MKAIIVTLGLALLAGPALAQVAPRAVNKTASPPRASAKPKVIKAKPRGPQRVDFTKGDLVEAGIDSGAGDVIGVRTPPRLSKLIPVRTDFHAELLKSAEDL